LTSFAILASGGGSNFDAIAEAVSQGRLQGRLVAVLSDRAGAPILEKARVRGIPALLVQCKNREDRAEHDAQVLAALDSLPGGRPRFLVMAGYMRIVTPALIRAFRDVGKVYSRIVNVHPSLLPAFSGVGGYAQAFEHGVKVTGVTVHLVDDGLDSGPICAQEAFSIEDCRTVAEVEARGKALEHRLYSQTLSWILTEKFTVGFGGPSGARVGESSLQKQAELPAPVRRYHVRPI
jgi:phosphoribosylglycinamide formyltransferase 1